MNEFIVCIIIGASCIGGIFLGWLIKDIQTVKECERQEIKCIEDKRDEIILEAKIRKIVREEMKKP